MAHRYSDSPVLRGLTAHRAAGNDTALAEDEIILARDRRSLGDGEGSDRPLRRYAHILVEIDESAAASFDALEAAVNAVPGCTTMGTTIPNSTTDTESRAEGFIEAAAEAHDIDLDDEHGSVGDQKPPSCLIVQGGSRSNIWAQSLPWLATIHRRRCPALRPTGPPEALMRRQHHRAALRRCGPLAWPPPSSWGYSGC